MQQESESFWADIKAYEERLALHPESYCFAKLSEVYLKVGLMEDALHTARSGVARYPGFCAGQRALALACHAKGLMDECRLALEKVTSGAPDDYDAQKLLARLCFESGDKSGAIQALRVLLDFYPGDVECRTELDKLEQVAEGLSDASFATGSGATDAIDSEFRAFEEESDEEIIEDLEILDVNDEDIITDDEDELESAGQLTPRIHAADGPVTNLPDPLFTATMAELYVEQGVIAKALEIYRTLFTMEPESVTIRARIEELEAVELLQSGPGNACIPTDEPPITPLVAKYASMPSATGVAVDAASVMEAWLENIRRIRACRYGIR